MNFIFSVANSPMPPPTAALRTVYRLHADPSYDVRKGAVPHADIVALRTDGGLGKVIIDGCEEIAVSPGTLLFFTHDKVRRYWCAAESWDFWWFELVSGEPLGFPMNRLLRIDDAEGEAADCAACLELLGGAEAGKAMLASSRLSLLLCKWQLKAGAEKHSSPHREAVEKAIGYMKRNMNGQVSVEDMAGVAGLSQRRFRQVFIGETGMQPKKYHDALRMRTAEELLLNTPCTVGEISSRLGYSSQFHFCKAFRSAHGVPPSRYRAGGSEQ